MNAKKIFYFALLAAVPYFGIAAAYFLMQQIWMLVALILTGFLIFLLTLVCVYKSQKNKWDAYSFTRAVMIVKIIQIPAYIINFVCCILSFMMLFTFPAGFLYFFTDCMALVMSGLVMTAAMLRVMNESPVWFKKYIWVIPLQFVFCADFFATVFIYKKLKTKKENKSENPE